MFFVCNKDKLVSFIIAITTVTILFMIATVIIPKNETQETSSNTVNSNIINDLANNNIENNAIIIK